MSLIYGHIPELGITVPLRRQIRWTDPRDEKEYEGWEIALDEVDEVFWPKLLADMRSRFPDAPKDDAEFRRSLMEQGTLPIRSERVHVMYDLRGFI